MSTELDRLVNTLAVESGATPNLGVKFEPHEVEEGDLIVFMDLGQEPPQRVLGVCLSNQNGMLAIVAPFEQVLLYRAHYADIENIQLIFKTHHIIHQNELKNLVIATREYCSLNKCWSKAEDILIKNFIKWRQEKFHPTPPPKLSFFKRLKNFIYE